MRELLSRRRLIKAVYGQKPLYATEWNCFRSFFQDAAGRLKKSAWATCLKDAVKVVRSKTVESGFDISVAAGQPLNCFNAGVDYTGQPYNFFEAFKVGLSK